MGVTKHSVIGNGRPGWVDAASWQRVPGHRGLVAEGLLPRHCPAVGEGAGDKALGPERPGSPWASGLPHAAKASAAAGTRAGRAKRASRGGRLGVAATWPPASPGHSGPPQQGSWFVSSQPTLLPSLLQLLSIWAPVPPAHGGRGGRGEGVSPHLPAGSGDTRVALPSWRGTGLTAGHPGPEEGGGSPGAPSPAPGAAPSALADSSACFLLLVDF